jgi:hypothetical protein
MVLEIIETTAILERERGTVITSGEAPPHSYAVDKQMNHKNLSGPPINAWTAGMLVDPRFEGREKGGKNAITRVSDIWVAAGCRTKEMLTNQMTIGYSSRGNVANQAANLEMPQGESLILQSVSRSTT